MKKREGKGREREKGKGKQKEGQLAGQGKRGPASSSSFFWSSFPLDVLASEVGHTELKTTTTVL